MKHTRLALLATAVALTLSSALAQPPGASAAPAAAPAATKAPAPKPDASAPIEKIDTNGNFRKAHDGFLARGKAGPVGLLFIGDSITAGWAGRGKATWAENYEKYQAANFGIGGDQTQHVIWRIENGELEGIKPKVTVLMIGTNNTGQHNADEIAAANKKIVQLIRAKIPDTKVLVLAVFPRAANKNKEGVITDDAVKTAKSRMEVIRGVNAQLAKLDDGKNVRFLDIGPKFLDADGKISFDIMPDQLHLSEAGYKIWADAMRPTLEAMLK